MVKLLGPGEYVLERRTSRGADGHFGLAVAEYAHSTAPNRRYADLVTQRLVKGVLDGTTPEYTEDALMAIAARCTEREDAARKVERTVRKSVAAALCLDRIGDRFTAIVTGASDKGTYVRVLRPPLEGRVVRGPQGLDVGDTVRVKLIGADPEKGFIDFEGPASDVEKNTAPQPIHNTAKCSDWATVGYEWCDQTDTSGTSRAGVKAKKAISRRPTAALAPVSRSRLTGSVNVNPSVPWAPVHGFIDFEYGPGVESRKSERTARKKAAAWRLRGRVGESFAGVVTGSSPRATYVRIDEPEAEGRIVRGGAGLQVGEPVRVVLLAADPRRGYIDFARDTDR